MNKLNDLIMQVRKDAKMCKNIQLDCNHCSIHKKCSEVYRGYNPIGTYNLLLKLTDRKDDV